MSLKVSLQQNEFPSIPRRASGWIPRLCSLWAFPAMATTWPRGRAPRECGSGRMWKSPVAFHHIGWDTSWESSKMCILTNLAGKILQILAPVQYRKLASCGMSIYNHKLQKNIIIQHGVVSKFGTPKSPWLSWLILMFPYIFPHRHGHETGYPLRSKDGTVTWQQ